MIKLRDLSPMLRNEVPSEPVEIKTGQAPASEIIAKITAFLRAKASAQRGK